MAPFVGGPSRIIIHHAAGTTTETDWWDLRLGPIERVYGPDRLERAAGYLASTSPQNGPVPNAQAFSELMRRDINMEPMNQPNWRAPSTAMGNQAPGTGFTPQPGSPMPAPNTWLGNAELVQAGRGVEISSDKVNDMRGALLGLPDISVLDRHYAKIGDAPELGVYMDEMPNKITGSMNSQQISAYAVAQNELNMAAKEAGVPVSVYSAWVWEGARQTIRRHGKLFGQQHRASAIPDTTEGFNEIFEQLVEKKAKHLGITVAQLETMLRAGSAELLGLIMATGVGAEVFRQSHQQDQGPVGDEAVDPNTIAGYLQSAGRRQR